MPVILSGHDCLLLIIPAVDRDSVSHSYERRTGHGRRRGVATQSRRLLILGVGTMLATESGPVPTCPASDPAWTPPEGSPKEAASMLVGPGANDERRTVRNSEGGEGGFKVTETEPS